MTKAKILATTVSTGQILADGSISPTDVGLGNVENKSSATIRAEITSSNVTSALGFTPLSNSTSYLPLSGGTLTGSVAFGSVYHYSGGIRFFTGNSNINYLFTGTGGMIWRNQADSATIANLSDSGALNAAGAITQAGNQVLHAGNYTSYSPSLSGSYINMNVGGLYSRYSYQGGEISDATTAYTLSPNYGTTTVAMHGSHGDFGGYATTLTMSGYERYGAYQISGNYNASTPALSMRNYSQTTSGWTSWTRLLSSANYSSYALPLSGGTLSGALTINSGSAYTLQLSSSQRYQFRIRNTSATAQTNGWWLAHDNGGNLVIHADSVGDIASLTSGGTFNSTNLTANGNQVLHAGNYTSYAAAASHTHSYLPLAGGSLTGNLSIAGGSVINFAGQSDTIGYNSTAGLGTYIKGTSTTYIYGGGSFYDGTYQRTLLHAGNYSSYASPLWYQGWVTNPGYDANTLPGSRSGFSYSNNAANTGTLVHFDSGGYGLQLSGSYANTSGVLAFRNRNGDAGTWNAWRDILHSGNYNSYSPTLTGSGASGTWGIAITGNAATASVATSANKTNGNSGYARVGTGMAPFYNWGGASAGGGAPSAGSYTTGIDVGSHPSDQAYGFQIACNMFNENAGLWTRAYNSGFTSWVKILDSSNYNSYSPTLTGSGASGTWSINVTGNAATATTADQIDSWPFRNTGSNGSTNADTIESNGITYYSAGVPNFTGNATDGALYSQAYSTSWQHQIAGDYRSGQIAIRGKNSGTWQAWRTVLDSSNVGSYAAPVSHVHTISNITGLTAILGDIESALIAING